MTIVVYSDVILPNSVILAGVTGKRTRQNDRTENQGGYASVNAVRDTTIMIYQIGIAPMLVSDIQAVIAIQEITDAGTFGFLMEDPIDSTVTGTQGALLGYQSTVENGIVGFGNGTPDYGFRKVYTAAGSSRQRARALTRPKGSPAILRNGAAVTYGAAAGNVAVSAGPIYAAFVPDATASVSSITPGATTTVVLSAALAGLVITTGKLWLQGLTGADAALLNNMAHTITAISATTYTLATNTAGKTITAAGQGHKYPQPTETLTWSGGFYVPVHFASDDLEWDIVAAGQAASRFVSVPSLTLDEVRE